MKFLICGSGASEGIPALFCSCAICEKARRLGGREVRTRTAYHFGESVRIDFGPDLLLQQMKYDLHLDRLEHIFLTHTHKDHFTPLNLTYRRAQYVELEKMLSFHAGKEALEQILTCFKENNTNEQDCRVSLREVEAFRSEILEADGEKMLVTPLPSDHMPKGKTVIYDILVSGRRILIGNDSGIYPDETWEYFKGKRYDFAIMDATSGVLPIRNVHMGRECLVETVQRLRSMGVYDSDTLILTNHFSHNGKMNHDDLERYYAPHGIFVGYDGFTLDLSQQGVLHYV